MIKIDPVYFSPTEVELFIGERKHITNNKLTWKPNYTLDMIIGEIITGDLKEAKRQFVQKV